VARNQGRGPDGPAACRALGRADFPGILAWPLSQRSSRI
jgi:hypothetical protein